MKKPKIVMEAIKDIQREESYLAFEARLEAKVAVTPDTLTCNALDGIHLFDRMISGRESVVSDEIVGRRDEEATNLNHGMEQ